MALHKGTQTSRKEFPVIAAKTRSRGTTTTGLKWVVEKSCGTEMVSHMSVGTTYDPPPTPADPNSDNSDEEDDNEDPDWHFSHEQNACSEEDIELEDDLEFK